ncbi:MAG: ABC transporter substrate-binding protein [Dehalococcoidia bacterium]|nr:ABC transporter substrate-binding protein [Dehalococcoidia bacterium]MDD5648508.1 ABC transporter substrate-binding protein [Dehalococcoidia bacterium]
MKRILILATIITVVIMLLPACTAARPQLHTVKGTFVESQLGESAQTLNWIIATDGGASRRYASFMVEPLAVYDNQYKLQPRCMARALEVTPDGLTYTVTIRDDLKWSDGTSVTADDYVYTINNIMLADWLECADKSRWQEEIGGNLVPVTVEAISGTAFKIVRKTTDPNFEYTIYDLMPYPKNIASHYENTADEFMASPEFNNMSYCGNLGPYRPIVWTSTEGIVLERNPYYYLGKDNGAPYFEKYIINQPGMQQTINEGLNDGQISFAFIEPQDANSFRSNPDLQVVTIPSGQFLMLAYNQRDNGWIGLKDPRVRQAISMAIDKSAIINDIFGGYADPAYGIVPPYSPWYSENATQKFGMNAADDAQKAIDLIKSAGYEMKDIDGKQRFVDEDGKAIKLALPIAIDSEVQKAAAYIIGQSLNNIGFEVEPKYQVQDFVAREIYMNKVPGVDRNPEYNSGPGAVSIQPWDLVILSSFGDALTIGRSEIFFSTKGRLNIFGFFDDKIDALYEKASSAEAVDPVNRQKIYDELSQAISEAQPVDFIVYYKDNFAFSNKIKGIQPGINMFYNYQSWYEE